MKEWQKQSQKGRLSVKIVEGGKYHSWREKGVKDMVVRPT
jgi:hypothetical protein